MQTLKTILFLLLAAFMIYAGVSHLTFHRLDFVAEVPMWLRFSDGFTDFVVLASGVVEIVLGLSMLLLWPPQSQDRRPVGSFLCAGFPRQPQSVYLPHRRIRLDHRHATTHSPLLPAGTHRVGALVHGWLECLESRMERLLCKPQRIRRTVSPPSRFSPLVSRGRKKIPPTMVHIVGGIALCFVLFHVSRRLIPRLRGQFPARVRSWPTVLLR